MIGVVNGTGIVQRGNKMKNPCNCGTATFAPHEVATNECQRIICKAPIQDGPYHWIVNGIRITDTTLFQQRGYGLHEGGVWSRFAESTNSLEGDW